MYAFESTNDFGHKTGYVTDITTCIDLLTQSFGYYRFYPLETPIEFDNLFVRFKNEIDASIASGVDFDSGILYIARLYYAANSQLTSYYYAVKLQVVNSESRIKIYRDTVNSKTATMRTFVPCDFTDYQNGTHAYNRGRIFLLRFREPDQQAVATLLDTWNAILLFGDVAGYIGTYENPSSSYPGGRMVYAFSAYTIPSLIQTGTVAQNGFPTAGSGAAERRAAQPELVATTPTSNQAYSTGGTANKAMFVSSTGEYDPDPDPPGPTPPGPTPSSDPNYDPHTEPGDNPSPSPGGQNREYDPVPIPPKPSVTAVGAGFTTLYRPTAAILKLLAGELYSDNTIQIISNFFSDPYDMIAGLSIVPFIPPVSGRAKHRIGLFESDISMDVISDQFVDVNCGDILIDPYYNSFLDHSPYTRLLIWLPYIGYQEIDPDEVMGQMLNVTYRCDCLSGACTAFVNTGVVGETGPQIPRVLAQFSGNCSVQIPTAAASYDNLVSSAINILTTAANAGIGQASVAASMAAMSSGKHPATQAQLDSVQAHADVSVSQSLVGCAGDVVRAMKPSVTRNGTPGSTAGYMGVQKPYLIKIVPRSSIPDDETFMNMRGYPSNKVGTLSDYSGYCEVEDIQLNDVPATIGEINEIYALLKGGVIL